MKKFMILFISPVPAEEQMMNVTPEQMKEGMEPWLAWYEKHGAAMVDGGTPLGKGLRFSPTKSMKAESQVGGYCIVQAEDMDGAMALLENHPHFMLPEGSIEIFELMPMPM